MADEGLECVEAGGGKRGSDVDFDGALACEGLGTRA